ncbi:sugar transferase [Collinsella sp. An268]|uniref:sugar transferase n=1 Tax=Collinsella sp. An268 TaxID=1965612 RepID=UPI0019CFD588|nr:sugar transferase [Collinsella sp. An268]
MLPVPGTAADRVAPRGEDARFSQAELERIAQGIEGRLLYRTVKRLFDIAFSLAVLVVLLPVHLAVALAVYLDDPHGSPLFFQERVGRRGRTFRMVKFRSMYVDAEDRLESLMSANEKDGPVFKIREDPRITRVGRFIRKTSLDELPQFWNVLVGDIPLRILKTRPEFSEKSMGAFALPAKSSTNKEKAFSQVVSCFANGLRMRRISLLNCNCIGGMETQFLTKPVFGVSPVHPGTLFQKSNNGLAKAAW